MVMVCRPDQAGSTWLEAEQQRHRTFDILLTDYEEKRFSAQMPGIVLVTKKNCTHVQNLITPPHKYKHPSSPHCKMKNRDRSV